MTPAEIAGRLTDARSRILRILHDGEWRAWRTIPSANALPSLRRTAFRRRGRTIPWEATGAPMVAAGWIEERPAYGSDHDVRITEAGRRALAARDGGGA